VDAARRRLRQGQSSNLLEGAISARARPHRGRGAGSAPAARRSQARLRLPNTEASEGIDHRPKTLAGANFTWRLCTSSSCAAWLNERFDACSSRYRAVAPGERTRGCTCCRSRGLRSSVEFPLREKTYLRDLLKVFNLPAAASSGGRELSKEKSAASCSLSSARLRSVRRRARRFRRHTASPTAAERLSLLG
jgi:hypothetical protein